MPQRFLRPGLRDSDKWNACSFAAQSLYIRLLTLVDDYGRYDARISIIKGHAMALRDDVNPQHCAALRSELQSNALLLVYACDGKECLQLTNWQERARGASRYPAPTDSNTLRNPAESCGAQEKPAVSSGILPPSASPLVLVPSHRHESSPSPLVETETQVAALPTSDKKAVAKKIEPVSVADWLKSLGENPAYQFINVHREFSKMTSWCQVNRKQPTRRRFINWLNRTEIPLQPHSQPDHSKGFDS